MNRQPESLTGNPRTANPTAGTAGGAALSVAECPIGTWQRFSSRVRPRGALLEALPGYQAPLLVAGCQRSGGTMLASVISRHPDVGAFAWSKDAELDAALLLSGVVAPPPGATAKRLCFQTTYLNEGYPEYFRQAGCYSLIWLVRNPQSVVYSMLYNWSRFALNELFIGCGSRHLGSRELARYLRYGPRASRPIVRACLSYLEKARQAQELAQRLPADSVLFLDYDELVKASAPALEAICRFAGLSTTSADLGSGIRVDSLTKASRLAQREADLVEELCGAAYRDVKCLAA